MFSGAIHELFELHIRRIEKACDTDDARDRVQTALRFLERRDLDADAIDKDCAAELKAVLLRKYETGFAASGRLDGRGWSQKHISEHMERFLRGRLHNVNNVLRAAVCSDEPLTDKYLSSLLDIRGEGPLLPPSADSDAEDTDLPGETAAKRQRKYTEESDREGQFAAQLEDALPEMT